MSVTSTSTNLAFQLKTEIGLHGKNSQVYTALDTQLNCEIAVKRLLKSKIKDSAKFFEEARRVNDSKHQNVVAIKFASEDADHIYLGMPYYPNGSLKQLIDKRFLTVREVIRYSIQFLSGLNNIHVKKLIHFDIKPDNILISDTNEALVTDFGIAQNMDLFGLSEIDKAYFKHLPPEYFTTTKHSMLFDIYSAGLTIYRLCNGNQVFYEQFNKYPDRLDLKTAILNGQFPNRESFKYHIPKKLRKVIKKSLSIKPEDRYQTVLEFFNDLGEVDELLDWQYTESGDIKTWIKESADRKISISLKKLATLHYDLTTLKTINSSGKTTRVSAGCVQNLPESSVEKTVTALLQQYDEEKGQ